MTSPEARRRPSLRSAVRDADLEPNLTGGALVEWYRGEYGENAIVSEAFARYLTDQTTIEDPTITLIGE
jgi:hypothetical protein